MKWGEWQSVIQIGIALNFAFSTLRDIRHGGLDAEITGLRATIAALSAHPHLSVDARTKSVREYQSVLGKFLNARELYINHDRYIKWPCLISGILLCVYLVFSSVQYETHIDNLYYQALLWIVIVLAFVPFIVGGLFNIVFDHFTRKDLVSKRRSADQQLEFDVIC